ncbi:MAG: T9SS type A sorting domain-containing protein [Flavobacteriales bacterium]|nr:T9SS type A sorting domain-containing protein [Flavobacteriales bacterium]
MICFLWSSQYAQDDCASALAIQAGLHTVTLVDGTEVPQPICAANGDGADNGEWYTYTPTEDYTVTVTSDLAQNEGIDTRFHVYTGECGNLTCWSGDDDNGSVYLSIASFQVLQGVTYTIAWDDRWSDSGFDFELIENDPIESPVSFVPQNIDLAGSGLAVVDMNNDGLDDVLGVSGSTLNIHHQQTDGTLLSTTVITPDPDFSPSWSLAAGDLDANGMTDLLYGGGSGVTIMIANEDGTGFTEISGPEYVFSQRSNMVDINNDGNLDAFVCHDVQPNVYYLNDGNGNFTYYQGGLGETPDGGNYGSVWIDFDNDHDIDMFIAKCRGGDSPANINQLHRNLGGGVYEEIAADFGLADNVQTWSSAWGDFDNDGDMDALVGASSTVNGSHKLMRNGGSIFTDVTEGSGFDTASGTGIENCTQDFNNDGYLDVLGVGGNLMLNNGDMTFTEVDVPIGNGPIGDLDNNGFLDVLNGSNVFFNQGNNNNWLKVHLQGVQSNRDGIGARVEVTSALGTQIRDIRSGEGFRYMSSLTAHFGIAEDTEIDQVVVHWPSGAMDVIENPGINTTMVVVEGMTTGLEELSNASFQIYPSPAEDFIRIDTELPLSNQQVSILDIKGTQIINTSLNSGRVDVSTLSSGQYMIRIWTTEGPLEQSFIKK